MKWFALFWVYRREFWKGWKRGWRRAVAPLLTRNEARARMNYPPLVGVGWIERPLEAPPFTKEAVRRIYGED